MNGVEQNEVKKRERICKPINSLEGEKRGRDRGELISVLGVTQSTVAMFELHSKVFLQPKHSSGDVTSMQASKLRTTQVCSAGYVLVEILLQYSSG